MKQKTAKWALALMLLTPCTPHVQAQSIWDKGHLENVKTSIEQPFYATSYQALKAEATRLLTAEPLSVIMKDKTPASHVTTLALAWYFSGDELYAQKATELIRVWFLNKDTRMNPNLEYAQMVPGHDNGKGRCYGLIDTYSFVEMLDAVALLEQSKAFTPKDSKQLKAWFARLTDWMLTSKQGKEEATGANNHSVAYDAQIAAFALYTGNKKLAREVIEAFPQKRIFPQVEPDGSQPHELRRTLAFHYSQYNLAHFVDLMLMGRKLGLNIDHATSADGRNFYKAMDFLTPYAGKPLSAWPYQQISGWESTLQNFYKELYRTATYLDPARKDYLRLYRAHRVWEPQDRFNLLYVNATETDHAYAFAAGQLQLAMKCADTARKDEKNAARRRVMPRSINKDGSLAMIHPHDWCSGFFPGSLWQMYAYTHSDFWRQSAVSWTWPVEEAKWHKGTHDLGFMMYDSFGKAYALTGERSYLDVVIQSAKTLVTRYSPKVKSIRSWDHNRDKWKHPVIIDNMMNLEMLFEATRLTGDSTFWKVAVNHANTTMKNHFRPDYSSYHVVDYDPETGTVRTKCTHQGNSDDSFWSRGQGWGLYGFAMCYRYTKDPAYLKQSESIADFFLALPNMPADGVPYWDMKMDVIKECTPENVNPDVPRDASAAALIASGLYELCTYVAPEKGKQYRAFADKIVNSLHQHYQAEPGTYYGFLLLHSTGHHPGGSEIDVPLNYADYFYLEALARKAALDMNTVNGDLRNIGK